MGFFDDIGAIVNDLKEVRDDITDTVKRTVDDVSSSAEEIKTVGKDATNKIKQTGEELKDSVTGAPKE